MAGRADRILTILKGGRLSVQEIHRRLAAIEALEPDDLNPAVVSATVSQDNRVRVGRGEVKRFRIYGDGDEEYGYVSLIERKKSPVETTRGKKSLPSTLKLNFPEDFPLLVEASNNVVREELKEAISKLSWREFESNFLTSVLEALGLEDVEITAPTRDGGRDASCSYKRGIVTSEAIVSAKHWKRQRVGPDEVQRLRGVQGPADTAIIATFSGFTDGAIRESAPSQNQRSMVLIDGDLIVETCIRQEIGVQKVDLPELFRLEEPLISKESTEN